MSSEDPCDCITSLPNAFPEVLDGGSAREAWLECPICGHIWRVRDALDVDGFEVGDSADYYASDFQKEEKDSRPYEYEIEADFASDFGEVATDPWESDVESSDVWEQPEEEAGYSNPWESDVGESPSWENEPREPSEEDSDYSEE